MTNLVTTDSVRAVLGVSAKELPDSVLTNSIYSVRLSEDLRDLNPSMVADYTTISTLTGLTDDQQRFVDLIQTYAAYNVARQCLVALPMFSPQTIKDEKAELTRGAAFYAQLKKDVGEVLSIMRGRLLKAYVAINSAALAPAPADYVFGLAVGLGTDPVTGS